MNTDDLDQYLIVVDVTGLHVVTRVTARDQIGKRVAAHKNIGAVRLVIPATHVRANQPVEAPIVEVWIDKRIANA